MAERLVGTTESRQRDLMTVVGDAGDADVLRAAGVPRAEVVYVAAGDSATNLSIAVRASSLARGRETPLAVYAHIADPELCVSLQARRLGLPHPPGVRLDFFNIDDLAARVLFDRWPLPAFEERPTRVLIAGGSRLAEALLVQAARHWRVGNHRAHPLLHVDYVAPHADAAVGALTARYPFLRRTCRITPVPVELTIALAGGALGTPHDQSFLCYREESHGLKVALTTHRLWHGGPGSVFVPLYQLTDLSVAFDGADTYQLLDEVQGCLRLFGMIEAACDPVLIGEDLVERLARLIHEHYVARSRAAGDGPATASWSTGSTSTRSVAAPTATRPTTSAPSCSRSAASSSPASTAARCSSSPRTRSTSWRPWSSSAGRRTRNSPAGSTAMTATTKADARPTCLTGGTCPRAPGARTATRSACCPTSWPTAGSRSSG
ncbi:NAD-binding protein [Luedemannella flava]